MSIDIDERIFIKNIGYTLSEVYGDAYNKIQKRYGKRCNNLEYIGFDYNEISQPTHWVTHMNEEDKSIVQVKIGLTKQSSANFLSSCFEIVHETVHIVLAPKFMEDSKALVIEEGIATHFSCEYLDKSIGSPMPLPEKSKYAQAKAYYEHLCKLGPKANEESVVKEIRKEEINFREIKFETLLKIVPELSIRQAKAFCLNFEEWDPKEFYSIM